MSTLYIVATPIGNLKDMTFRAVSTLKQVNLVLCEDTRVTRKLLDAYEIKTPTLSYHSQSKDSKVEKIFKHIRNGDDIALVSDAGTPAVSDPGSLLVNQVREEFGDAVETVAIPGASAVTAALSISGLPSSEFLFLGFLPHKKGRQTLFGEINESKRTVAFYESPHRLMKSLETLENILDEKRIVVVTRELTKIHESSVRGSASEVLEYFKEHDDQVRGEIVILVSGKK